MKLRNNLFALFIALLMSSGLSATIEVKAPNLFIPSALNGLRLFHDERGFFVEKDNKFIPVLNECIDTNLVNVSDEKLELLLGLKAKINIDGQEQVFIRISPELAAKLHIEEMIPMSPQESENIASQIPAGSYIKVFQFSDGEYGLHLMPRLNGAGGFGAVCGALFGKFIVHAAAGAASGLVGLAVTCVAGPVAGAAAGAGVWGVMAPTVEVASNVVALAGGITGGVITGPV